VFCFQIRGAEHGLQRKLEHPEQGQGVQIIIRCPRFANRITLNVSLPLNCLLCRVMNDACKSKVHLQCL
jgi:hypothetical protein